MLRGVDVSCETSPRKTPKWAGVSDNDAGQCPAFFGWVFHVKQIDGGCRWLMCGVAVGVVSGQVLCAAA